MIPTVVWDCILLLAHPWYHPHENNMLQKWLVNCDLRCLSWWIVIEWGKKESFGESGDRNYQSNIGLVDAKHGLPIKDVSNFNAKRKNF